MPRFILIFDYDHLPERKVRRIAEGLEEACEAVRDLLKDECVFDEELFARLPDPCEEDAMRDALDVLLNQEDAESVESLVAGMKAGRTIELDIVEHGRFELTCED